MSTMKEMIEAARPAFYEIQEAAGCSDDAIQSAIGKAFEAVGIPSADDLVGLVNAYDDLLKKAFYIVENAPRWGGTPYWQFDSQFARLNIDDDVATIRWPESVGGYEGEHSIEEQTFSFDTDMLTWSMEEIKAWHRSEARQAKKDKQLREAQAKANREASERATFEALKAKFEPKTK